MLLNIKTGWQGMTITPMRDIAILVASVHRLAEDRVTCLLVDRHAYLAAARFSSDTDGLSGLDWPRLQEVDFRRRPDDPELFERYQAEALVHGHLPVRHLNQVVCYGTEQLDDLAEQIERRGLEITVSAQPTWYF